MKRKLLNSFIILTSSTLLSKVFTLLNRMLLSRILSNETMSLYILILPTLSLCITLAQCSLPSAVFRLISNPRYNNLKIIISAFLLSFICIIIMMLLVLCSAYPISFYLLKNSDAYIPILSLILFIPLVGISGIIKNYYLGKEDVWHLSIAHFIEESIRLISTYVLIKMFYINHHGILVCYAIISMCLGELCSIVYLLFHIRKTIPIRSFFIKDNYLFKDIMHISLPLTASRLLHSFYNFLEPVILIYTLSKIGLKQNDIYYQYSIINGYVISMLLTPTFFNNVILRLLIPVLNKDLAYNKKKNMQNHILLSVCVCFLISLPFTFLFYFYSEECLYLLYHNTDGAIYLKYMSIPFILFYLQTPLSATLQVLNKNKIMFYMSILEIIIEFICLFLFVPIYHTMAVAIVLNIGLLSTLILSVYFIYIYVYA